MYESYFGLKEKPFNLSPDPSFLYMSPGHENVYSHLEYSVRENKGFAVITGEVGSGKTTLINYLVQRLKGDYVVGIINHTDVTFDQLLQMIAMEFNLLAVNLEERAAHLKNWTEFLIKQRKLNKKVILIIDEAQNLPLSTLEGLRMLSNLEGYSEPLIQIILVGQPELRESLKTNELRQLSQRVTVHTHLESLSFTDVYNYIMHRLKIAQAENPDSIFSKKAIKKIAEYSNGLPRLINYLCDTAMVYAFADELKTIDEEIIASVVATRQIGALMGQKEKPKEELVPAIEIAEPAIVTPLKANLTEVKNVEARELRKANPGSFEPMIGNKTQGFFQAKEALLVNKTIPLSENPIRQSYPQNPPSSAPKPELSSVENKMSDRLIILEKRLADLESLIKTQNGNLKQVNKLIDSIQQRDGIILNLFKMLSDNITGRQKALRSLYEGYKEEKLSRKEEPSPASTKVEVDLESEKKDGANTFLQRISKSKLEASDLALEERLQQAVWHTEHQSKTDIKDAENNSFLKRLAAANSKLSNTMFLERVGVEQDKTSEKTTEELIARDTFLKRINLGLEPTDSALKERYQFPWRHPEHINEGNVYKDTFLNRLSKDGLETTYSVLSERFKAPWRHPEHADLESQKSTSSSEEIKDEDDINAELNKELTEPQDVILEINLNGQNNSDLSSNDDFEISSTIEDDLSQLPGFKVEPACEEETPADFLNQAIDNKDDELQTAALGSIELGSNEVKPKEIAEADDIIEISTRIASAKQSRDFIESLVVSGNFTRSEIVVKTHQEFPQIDKSMVEMELNCGHNVHHNPFSCLLSTNQEGKVSFVKDAAGADEFYIIDFIESLVETGNFTRSEIIAKSLEEFPKIDKSTVEIYLSDGHNLQHNRFSHLLSTNLEGKISFVEKNEASKSEAQILPSDLVPKIEVISELEPISHLHITNLEDTVADEFNIMAFIESLVESGNFTRSEIIAKSRQSFPLLAKSTIEIYLSDGHNLHHNPFSRLLSTNLEGKISFVEAAAGEFNIMAFIESLVESGNFTRSEIIAKSLEAFPLLAKSTIEIYLSDGHNLHYNPFSHLLITNLESKISFVEKDETSTEEAQILSSDLVPEIEAISESELTLSATEDKKVIDVKINPSSSSFPIRSEQAEMIELEPLNVGNNNKGLKPEVEVTMEDLREPLVRQSSSITSDFKKNPYDDSKKDTFLNRIKKRLK